MQHLIIASAFGDAANKALGYIRELTLHTPKGVGFLLPPG